MAISTYMPYGAYELKARYQFNLMLATLITATFCLLVFASVWILVEPDNSETIIIRDPAVISIPQSPMPEPIIIPDRPTIRGGGHTIDRRGAGPIVIIDDTVTTELNGGMYTQDEIAGRINDLYGTSGDAEGGEYTFEPTTDEIIPGPMDFQSLEIYPEMISQHVPDYPRLLQKAGIEGDVVVRVLLSEEGKVLDAIVHKSSGTDGLDEAAIEAAYKNVFSPGIQNRRPVKCWVSYKVVFELSR